jgi:hypothetical protein
VAGDPGNEIREVTRRLAFGGVTLVVLAFATAQAEPAEPSGEAAEGARTTGLPKSVQWTFHFDAGFGFFGFGNSLYTNARPDPSGDLSDNWMESYVKPALSAAFRTGPSESYGKISAVGERTYAAPPPLVGGEASSFLVEDLYAGWRSGKALGSTENVLDLAVGRAPYTLGHGFLLWDGGGEGGSRGGFWSNARKAWEFASIARLKQKQHTVEAFYLDRDEVPEEETGTRLWGTNYEFAPLEETTLGATYLQFHADPTTLPSRNGMSVYDVRAFTAPLRSMPTLSFELEFAREDNGDLLASTAWTAQAAYELSKARWSPRLSYRYAFFEGDDPATTDNESFDPLLPGFYDWGAWWQGEIAGEYFLANSNLVSHQARVHVAPSEAVGAGLIGYAFRLDQPGSYGVAGVTSESLATELDAYCDWKVNGNFTASFVAALGHPQDAVEQRFGRTDDFTYGMIYVAYSY